MICSTLPNSKISALDCDVRYVSRNYLKIHIWTNISQPIHDAWIHTVFNYRYKTYQKYAIDLWENACSWIKGLGKSYILDWTVKKLLKNTNYNHPCPYVGHTYIKINNISMSQFPLEPLMPSGQYRLDFNVTEGNRSHVLFIAKIFFSISDNRIERF